MSIESALEKLADAILVHAKALTALASAAGATPTPNPTKVEAKTEGEVGGDKPEAKDDPDREVYWQHEDGTYGKCTITEYKKLQKKGKGYSLIDPDQFKELAAAAKQREKDNAAAAEKAAKVKAAEAAKKKAEDDDAAGEITDEALGKLVKPFAGVEDPKERTRRVNWLKSVFTHYGVAKASELAQDQRAEFVALVEKAVAATEDDEGAELPDVESGDNELV